MSEEQKIRVVIADDQELVRAGFAMVIGSQPDMAVVGQARDGAEAVALAETLHPDVVLMDVRMPGVDGIEATRRISALQHRFAPDGSALDDAHTRVIILTTFDLDEYVMAAINAGASGFLLKDTEPETLLNSIRTVYQGNAIIAPSATKRLIEKNDGWQFRKRGHHSTRFRHVHFRFNGAGVYRSGIGRTDRPRARGAYRDRTWSVESGNRGQAVHQPAYRENACRAYSVENQCARPRASRRVRL